MVDQQPCRWIEIYYAVTVNDREIKMTEKLLIPDEFCQAGQAPLTHVVKAKAYIQRGNRDPEPLTDALDALISPIPILLCGALENQQPVAKKLVDSKLIRSHRIVPLWQRGKRLYIGMSDPTNLHALDQVKFHTNLSTEPIVVEESALNAAIDSYMAAQEESLTDSLGEMDDIDLENLDVQAVDEDAAAEGDSSGADEAPVVKFVNKVLLDAIRGGASDIHFEPYEKTYRVRFRTDGILQEVARPPASPPFCQ